MMNTKILKKTFAVFAGFMLLSNVFLPSAVVFADEGAPEATVTEAVNQEAEKVLNEQWENLENQTETNLQAENPAQQGGGGDCF